jgi:hypothetical protein
MVLAASKSRYAACIARTGRHALNAALMMTVRDGKMQRL